MARKIDIILNATQTALLLSQNRNTRAISNLIHDILTQTELGQIAADVQFAVKNGKTGNPEEIYRKFVESTNQIVNLVNNLFCVSGSCTVDTHSFNQESNIESCVFHYVPKIIKP